MRRWYREPLLHFVLAGAILFGAYAWFRGGEPAANDRTIVVDRRALLTFLQYRANAFAPETFGAALDGMTDAELGELVDAYIDEEVLYREARALGLEESDNIIRQRMVQKMSFLMADVASTGLPANEASLEAWFEDNIDAYAIQPWVTFTHIFFDTGKRGEAGARAAAEATRRDLNARKAGFNDAAGLGDGYPFLRNYVERTLEYVASHFGYEFVAEIEGLEPSEEWQGPFRSAYGEHIVLLTEKMARTLPSLDDVRDTVERDFATELSNDALKRMTRAIRDSYEIRIDELRAGNDR
jgi:PPIC-type PPIASE domain